jgi:hypothetical protein
MDADVLAGREERGLFNPLGGPAPNFLKLCFIIYFFVPLLCFNSLFLNSSEFAQA